MTIHTLPTSTRIARPKNLLIFLLRVLQPRWMRGETEPLPSHRRMGSWEANASFAARTALRKMQCEQRQMGED